MNCRQSPSPARNNDTNTRAMFICGQTHASPEPRPTGLTFFMYRACLGMFAIVVGWFVCHASFVMICRGVWDDERGPAVDVFPWSC
jgi:hypothetical protein